MSTSTTQPTQARDTAFAVDAPRTLAEPPPRSLGLADSLGLWGNLGISLLLPVAAAFVVLPGKPLAVTILAIVVGAVIGSVLLGVGAAAGAREGVPAMVLLRGLFGRRISYLPTVLNVVQCVGWATFEIVIIAEAASRTLHVPRWPFVLGAGALATLMALRPLGAVRVLARYAVWVAIAAVVYLFVRVLSHPLPPITSGGALSFWSAVDIVIALPVSWFPLAADYTRHVRGGRPAFVGSALGYGASTVAFFTLGVLALAAYGTAGLDVIDALLAVPLGALGVVVLIVVEIDEAFANIYSTAVSTQNLSGRLDRRLLALAVGVTATALAFVFDITAYEPFLFLIGAVFVPLVGVFVVAYLCGLASRKAQLGSELASRKAQLGGELASTKTQLGGELAGKKTQRLLRARGGWDTSDTAPARPLLLLGWVAGFVAYQLTLPTYFDGVGQGWTAWWAARQGDLGIDPANGWSASLVSLAVAATLTALVSLPALVRQRRPALTP